MTTPSPALNLSIAETGPIPNNQCALKDALLLALQTGETDAAAIVGNARAFLEFLDGAGVNPNPNAPMATPAAQQPAGDGAGQPVPAGVTPGVNDGAQAAPPAADTPAPDPGAQAANPA